MNTMPDDKLLTLLRKVDTPSVCNAIEVAQGQRGFAAFNKTAVHAAMPELPAICGFARTARIRAQTPPDDTPDAVRATRLNYYRYMAKGPRPAITVVEDLDSPDPVGAFWGEINTRVHRGFGIDGVLTNGVMRDLGEIPDDFQVLAGAIGPSHAYVHVVDYDQPVTVFGLTIKPGDFLHADRHGAVVVSPDVLPKLGEAIATMQASEAIVLEATKESGFDLARFEQAWTAFEKSRT